MADQQTIIRDIEFNLRCEGLSAAAPQIAAIKKEVDAVIRANKHLNNDYVALSSVIRNATKTYSTEQKKNIDSINKHSKAVEVLKKSYNGLKATSMSLANGIIPWKNLNWLQQYNQQMMKTSAGLTNFAISVKRFDGVQNQLRNSLKLTKQETAELFDMYQKGFPTVSIENFTRIVSNVKNVVGSNAEAIKEMMGNISGLVNKFPALQKNFESMDANSEERINTVLRLQLLSGKATLGEIRDIQKLTTARKSMNSEERKKQQETQDAMKQYTVLNERIMQGLSTAFMPFLTTLSKYIDNNGDKLSNMFQRAGDTIQPLVGGLDKLLSVLEKVFNFSSNNPKSAIAILAGLKFGLPAAGKLIASQMANNMSGGGGGSAGFARNGMMGGGVAGKALGIGTSAVAGFATANIAGAGDTKSMWIGAGASMAEGLAAGGLYGAITAGIVYGFTQTWNVGSEIKKGLNGLKENKQYTEDSLNKKSAMGGVVGKKADLTRRMRTLVDQEQRRGGDIFKLNSGSADAEEIKKLKKQIQDLNPAVKKIASDNIAAQQKSRKDGENKLLNQMKTDEEKQKRIRSMSLPELMAAEKNDKNALNAQRKKMEDIERSKSGGGPTIASQIAEQSKLGSYYETKKNEEGITDEQRSEFAKKQAETISTITALEEKRKQIVGTDMVEAENRLAAAQQKTSTEVGVAINLTRLLGESYKENAAAQAEASSSGMQAMIAQGTFSKEKGLALSQKAMEIENKSYEIAKENLAAGEKELQQLREQVEQGDNSKETIQLIQDREADVAKQASIVSQHFSRQQAIAMQVVQGIDKQNTVLAAQASKMEALVGLADNYAIGIGTSMQFRMQQNDVIQKQIEGEKSALEGINAAIASGQGDINELAKERADRESKILGLMGQQLAITKASRDGWVSAIAAMNTGSGTFTKIMTSQTKGMGVMMKELGDNAIISNIGGSTKGGYKTSERFDDTGNITGAYGHKNAAYDTTIGGKFAPREGIRNLEDAQRGNFQGFSREVTGRTKHAMSKGGSALAAGANPFGPSNVTDGSQGPFSTQTQYDGGSSQNGSIPPSSKNGNVNISTLKVSIEIKDLKNMGNEIVSQLEPALTKMAQDIASSIAG